MPKRRNIDPAEVANAKVLADREERVIQQEIAATIDLGLNIQERPAETAADFLRDEWDKKAFGEPPKTTTRIVYGPDPLVSGCPEFHERLERYGQEECAQAFRDLIMRDGEMAAPDPIMRKSLRGAINRFGREATADAFYDRVMRIPSRTVEIELDGAMDPLLSNPMREAVARYCEPGMSPKFLSDRCNQVLGLRGYQIVKDEHGDPVKVGTLIMGVIPQDWAERRRQHWAEQSKAQVREQEDAYYEKAAKAIHDSGVSGAAALKRGEMVTPSTALNDEWLHETRPTGFSVEETRGR